MEPFVYALFYLPRIFMFELLNKPEQFLVMIPDEVGKGNLEFVVGSTDIDLHHVSQLAFFHLLAAPVTTIGNHIPTPHLGLLNKYTMSGEPVPEEFRSAYLRGENSR